MHAAEWTKECPIAITVCDGAGKIIHMNPRSVEVFATDGGLTLIGQNVLDCHPEPARTKTRILLEQQKANYYTIEKAGRKKMIAQVPWYRQDEFAGLVELSFEIPRDMPHFVRDAGTVNKAPATSAEPVSGDDWITECPLNIMILDRDGLILEMNNRCALAYASDGGRKLLGRNAYDCHPEEAAAKLRAIVESAEPNIYTTERAGKKDLVVLLPWFRNGAHAGLIHIEVEIPMKLPNFIRNAAPAQA
jgi:hypothetical protein